MHSFASRSRSKEYQQVCSIYRCGKIYWATNDCTVCPSCHCSEHDIMLAGTNDKEDIYEYFKKDKR